MATEVNGNHAPYVGLEHQQNNHAYSVNGSSSSQATIIHPPPASSTPASAATASASNPTTDQKPDVSKDEVGWFFVEQYYTTLSRSPDQLHLFYNKRSQYVSGQETDKVSVCVGQRAIHDRIKTLDFQDCKVRVTNVDSQASDSNIVIQVIGEISNRSQPHQKFTQTFVLAPQTQGYFVLNDIFRYLVEEEDESEQAVKTGEENVEKPAPARSGYLEPTPTAIHTPPEKTLTSSASPAAVEHDAQQVDEEIKSKVPDQVTESDEPKVNGHAAEEEEVEDEEVENEPTTASLPTPPTEQEPVAEEVTPAPAEEQLQQEKKPAEPAPTPSPPKQATPRPAPAPKPAAQKTWASLAASANRVATPAAPSSTSSSTSQVKPAQKPAAAAASSTPAAPTPQAEPAAPVTQQEASPAEASQGDEWTAVGGSHNRNQSRQTNVNQQPEGPQYRGYIKNVHEGVDGHALKAHLETFGEVTYFDIARQKNCAFVDFKTHEGYKGAVDSGNFTISDESLYVEERKFRPGATPYIPRGRGRGGPGQGTPRGGYQGRGGYQPRGGRGGGPGGAPRGRGSSVAI